MSRQLRLRIISLLALVLVITTIPVFAWDSRLRSGFKFFNPMHDQFTSAALRVLFSSHHQLLTDENKAAILNGVLTELHEEDTKEIDQNDGKKYGLDLDKLRKKHLGTNEGCNDMPGWWQEAIEAQSDGRGFKASLFIVGIMLHMVQDMGVPAHANLVYHQGNFDEFDNFEFNATIHGSFISSGIIQDESRVNKSDPQYANPSRYYAFSQAWTKEDAPNYRDRNKYPKFRVPLLYDKNDDNLMRNRQIRTYKVSVWMLNSAFNAFEGHPNPNP